MAPLSSVRTRRIRLSVRTRWSETKGGRLCRCAYSTSPGRKRAAGDEPAEDCAPDPPVVDPPAVDRGAFAVRDDLQRRIASRGARVRVRKRPGLESFGPAADRLVSGVSDGGT